MADVVYKAIGTVAAQASGTTITPPLPAGWAAGDFAIVYAQYDGYQTFTWPTGWTEIRQAKDLDLGLIGCAYRFLVGGDANPIVTVSVGNNTTIARVITYSNVNISSPIHIASILQGFFDNSSPYIANLTGGTTTTNGAMAILVYAIPWYEKLSSPSAGFTERADDTTALGGVATLALSDKAMPTAGAIGTCSVTYSLAIYGWAIKVTLGPSAGATYTIVIGAGAYAETGVTSLLKKGSLVAISSGSYAETGTAVTLKKTSKISIDSTTFVETGFEAGLILEIPGVYNIWPEIGLFAESGIAATLSKTSLIDIGLGSFAETGTSIGFTRSYVLPPALGTFALTGIDVDLVLPDRISYVGPGISILSGTNESPLGGNFIISSNRDFITRKVIAGVSKLINQTTGMSGLVTGVTPSRISANVAFNPGDFFEVILAAPWIIQTADGIVVDVECNRCGWSFPRKALIKGLCKACIDKPRSN